MFVAVDSDELIQRVVALAEMTWREHYSAIIGEKQVDYMLAKFQSLDPIQEQIRNGLVYYLVTLEGKDVGYFSIRVEEEALFLSKLYIKSSESGCGLGCRTLKFIQEHWGAASVRLTVNKGNVTSIRFYENRGFIKTGEVVQDIGGGFVMDDFQMEWIC